MQRVGLALAVSSPARLGVLDGVVGDVPWRDLLSCLLRVLVEFGSDADGVLDQLLGVLTANGLDAVRNGGPDSGSDFLKQQFSSFWGHLTISWERGLETKRPTVVEQQGF